MNVANVRNVSLDFFSLFYSFKMLFLNRCIKGTNIVQGNIICVASRSLRVKSRIMMTISRLLYSLVNGSEPSDMAIRQTTMTRNTKSVPFRLCKVRTYKQP